ncbi:hypothetical protein CMI48_01690 [Candidatus Pacearchaeota archaeon]|jgi:hypothetical protein|nr:hypothetical protein [Candidatus Pacearchaeota archaeon]
MPTLEEAQNEVERLKGELLTSIDNVIKSPEGKNLINANRAHDTLARTSRYAVQHGEQAYGARGTEAVASLLEEAAGVLTADDIPPHEFYTAETVRGREGGFRGKIETNLLSHEILSQDAPTKESTPHSTKATTGENIEYIS